MFGEIIKGVLVVAGALLVVRGVEAGADAAARKVREYKAKKLAT